jgi:hypothetical protein
MARRKEGEKFRTNRVQEGGNGRKVEKEKASNKIPENDSMTILMTHVQSHANKQTIVCAKGSMDKRFALVLAQITHTW